MTENKNMDCPGISGVRVGSCGICGNNLESCPICYGAFSDCANCKRAKRNWPKVCRGGWVLTEPKGTPGQNELFDLGVFKND